MGRKRPIEYIGVERNNEWIARSRFSLARSRHAIYVVFAIQKPRASRDSESLNFDLCMVGERAKTDPDCRCMHVWRTCIQLSQN